MAGRTLVSVAAACFALCPIARIQARAISSFDSNDVTTHSLGIACKLSGANGTITKRGDDECQISDAFLFNAVKIGKKQILPILLASADAANPLLTKFWGHPDPRGKNWQETAVAARQDEYWTYEDNEDPDDIMELASVLEKLRVGSANARSRWQQQSRNVRSDMFSYDMFNTGPNVRIATVQDQKIGENKQGLPTNVRYEWVFNPIDGVIIAQGSTPVPVQPGLPYPMSWPELTYATWKRLRASSSSQRPAPISAGETSPWRAFIDAYSLDERHFEKFTVGWLNYVVQEGVQDETVRGIVERCVGSRAQNANMKESDRGHVFHVGDWQFYPFLPQIQSKS